MMSCGGSGGGGGVSLSFDTGIFRRLALIHRHKGRCWQFAHREHAARCERCFCVFSSSSVVCLWMIYRSNTVRSAWALLYLTLVVSLLHPESVSCWNPVFFFVAACCPQTLGLLHWGRSIEDSSFRSFLWTHKNVAATVNMGGSSGIEKRATAVSWTKNCRHTPVLWLVAMGVWPSHILFTLHDFKNDFVQIFCELV